MVVHETLILGVEVRFLSPLLVALFESCHVKFLLLYLIAMLAAKNITHNIVLPIPRRFPKA